MEGREGEREKGRKKGRKSRSGLDNLPFLFLFLFAIYLT